jgi:hypothetical protein
VVISAQLAFILYLIFYLFNAKTNAEPETRVAFFGNEIRVHSPIPGLPNFYEPPESTTVTMGNSEIPGYGSTTYTFNSDTLNEKRDYAVTKPDSTFRIIELGDSFVFGAYVNTEDNHAELLEQKLNQSCTAFENYEVLNLGVTGYDMTYSLERFKLRGLKYDPDLIAWMVTDGDFYVDQDAFDELYGRRYENALKEATQAGEQNADMKYDHYKATLETREEMARIYAKEDIVNKNLKAMLKMRELYVKPIVIFSAPRALPFEVRQFPNFKEFFKSPDTYLADSIGNLVDIQYIVSATDNHPNKLGSLLIADNLFDYLTSNNIVPCN